MCYFSIRILIYTLIVKEREETQTDRDTERQKQRQRGREQASKQAGAHHKTRSSFVRSSLISIKNVVSIAGVDDVTEQAEACVIS